LNAAQASLNSLAFERRLWRAAAREPESLVLLRIASMPRQLLFAGVVVSAFGWAGCLPPVEDATNKTPVPEPAVAEKADKDKTAAATPSTPDTEGFSTTASGLKYKIVKPGSDKKPKETDTVLCHYRGTLEDGTVFDSSYDRGMPIDFPLNGVIAGWTEGLQLIGEGGEIQLIIPGDLAYGPRGSPPKIGPNATLHFKVELIDVQ
jgi:FKBP-type peptidyl-prolyl cis-trans isomerase